MTQRDNSVLGVVKEQFHIAKYNPGRDPNDGEPPDDVTLVVRYSTHVDGAPQEITDPDMIAKIEAHLAEQEG